MECSVPKHMLGHTWYYVATPALCTHLGKEDLDFGRLYVLLTVLGVTVTKSDQAFPDLSVLSFVSSSQKTLSPF